MFRTAIPTEAHSWCIRAFGSQLWSPQSCLEHFMLSNSPEDWTSEYHTKLAAVAMKKLTILELEEKKTQKKHQ